MCILAIVWFFIIALVIISACNVVYVINLYVRFNACSHYQWKKEGEIRRNWVILIWRKFRFLWEYSEKCIHIELSISFCVLKTSYSFQLPLAILLNATNISLEQINITWLYHCKYFKDRLKKQSTSSADCVSQLGLLHILTRESL